MSSAPDRDLPVLQLEGELPLGRFAIEASAGTGKTYSLTALVARYVAEWGLRPEQLLMVTFTRTAAADMSHRTRLQVGSLVAALKAVIESPDAANTKDLDSWMKAVITQDLSENTQRLQRLEAFLSSYDETTITTIHGFFQIVLSRVGLSGPIHGDVTLVEDFSQIVHQVVSDLVIGELAEDPGLLLDEDGSVRQETSIHKELVGAVRTVFANLGIRIEPQCDPADFDTPLSELPVPKRWAVLVTRAVREIQDRMERGDLLSFDRLVCEVFDLIEGSDGEAIASSLREQFRVVLVDEFQDTDHMQWRILERAFGQVSPSVSNTAFGTVGDPKQAIYRFRGADIEAYRAAVNDVEQSSALTTNFRSSQRLIEAVNKVFAGTHFGADDIVYRAVGSRPDTSAEGVIDSPALEIRWAPFCEELGSAVSSGDNKAEKEARAAGVLDKWNLNTAGAVEAIYADMVREIALLLQGRQLVDKKGTTRLIRPGDIAVLVPKNDQADRISTVLSLAGIPAVRYRSQSVFQSRAAQDWQILLEALCRPTHSGFVRACMVSAFGDVTLDQLTAWTDEEATVVVSEWQRRCAEWAERLQRDGLAALYHHIRSGRGLEPALASQLGGERLLTDLDHIAEVLSRRSNLQRGATAADCRQELLTLLQDDASIDEYQRRIENDEDAVHVATVHFSKGLEYPIVFLPVMFQSGKGQEPWVYNADGQRSVDVAHKVHWTGADGSNTPEIRQELSARADLGDAMRKLYVAVTRAELKLVVYWTAVRGSAESALSRVFFGRNAAGAIEIDPERKIPVKREVRSNAAVESELRRLAGPGLSMEVTAIDPTTEIPIGLCSPTVDAVDVDEALLTRVEPLARQAWRKWSYSSVVAGRHEGWSGRNDDRRPGADEPGEVADTDLLEPRLASDDEGTLAESLPFILFPDALKGNHFGSMVHTLFERLDPADPTFESLLAQEISRNRWSWPEALIPDLIKALVMATRTPLGPLFGDRSLSMISARDRLAEAKFDLRLPHADSIDLRSILDLLEKHLPGDDPFRTYGRVWTKSTPKISGSLYGEIDAVFRVVRDDGTPTFIVADYKTNSLHRGKGKDQPPAQRALSYYSPDLLTQAMESNDYVIQALLYSVALHRHLGMRLPAYDPARHLGGVAYLFLRGMIGPETPRSSAGQLPDGQPYGVFTWNPPVALITAVDDLFAQELGR